MDDERLDLSALDPLREPERWDRVVERTRARVDEVIARRRPRQDPLAALASWARPVLAAAAVAAVLLAPAAWSAVDGAPGGATSASDAGALATRTVEWLRTGHRPTAAELVAAAGRGAVP